MSETFNSGKGRAAATRLAILNAAIETVASDGVGASTALAARRAGVSQGSVFSHFGTKNALLNAAYLHLKRELNAAVLDDLPTLEDDKATLGIVWCRWAEWGTRHEIRRRALFLLNASDVITPESRSASAEDAARGVELFVRVSAHGALAGKPIEFIGAAVEGIAGATMDAMLRDQTRADQYRDSGFEALWNMLR